MRFAVEFVVKDFLILISYLYSLLKLCGSLAIDNGLASEPEVLCDDDSVVFKFKTQNSFTGKIFVKGHYNDADCKVDYTGEQLEAPFGRIKIKHGKCSMERQRMISPQGMQFSTVVVLSFHPVFITKVDKAYSIKCMYKEATKAVTASIDVSMLPTIPVTQNFPMPSCTYTIRRDEIDGEVLRYAKVGDQVVHRWECDSNWYGILVHSCYVEDGQGEKVLVVDEKGCHTDRLLLGDPTYIEALNMAYRESNVFKFADRVAVRFQCQIKLCIKMDSGCTGITPPLCDSAYRPGGLAERFLNKTAYDSPISFNDSLSHFKRQRRSLYSSDTNNFGLVNSTVSHETVDYKQDTANGDFQSQYLYVLDAIETSEKGDRTTNDVDWSQFLSKSRHKNTICLTTATFVIFSSFLIFSLLVSTCSIVAVLWIKHRQKRKTGTNQTNNAAATFLDKNGLWDTFNSLNFVSHQSTM